MHDLLVAVAYERIFDMILGKCDLPGMGWDGKGWDWIGWDGMEWDGMGYDGMRWDGMG